MSAYDYKRLFVYSIYKIVFIAIYIIARQTSRRHLSRGGGYTVVCGRRGVGGGDGWGEVDKEMWHTKSGRPQAHARFDLLLL